VPSPPAIPFNDLVRGVAAGGSPAALGSAADEAFISALNAIFLVSAGIAFVGAVVVLLLVRSRDLSHGRAPAAEA